MTKLRPGEHTGPCGCTFWWDGSWTWDRPPCSGKCSCRWRCPHCKHWRELDNQDALARSLITAGHCMAAQGVGR